MNNSSLINPRKYYPSNLFSFSNKILWLQDNKRLLFVATNTWNVSGDDRRRSVLWSVTNVSQYKTVANFVLALQLYQWSYNHLFSHTHSHRVSHYIVLIMMETANIWEYKVGNNANVANGVCLYNANAFQGMTNNGYCSCIGSTSMVEFWDMDRWIEWQFVPSVKCSY